MLTMEPRETTLIGRDCSCHGYAIPGGYGARKSAAKGRVMAIVIHEGREVVDVWTEDAGRQFYPRERVTIHRTSVRSTAGAAGAKKRRRSQR